MTVEQDDYLKMLPLIKTKIFEKECNVTVRTRIRLVGTNNKKE